MKTPIICCTLAIIASLSACKKSDQTAVQSQNASVAFQLKATNEAPTTGRMEGSLITWDSGYAHVAKVVFDGEGDCDGHVRREDEHEGEEHEEYDDSLLHHHKACQDSLNNKVINLFAPSGGSVDTVAVSPCHYKKTMFEIMLRPDSTTAALELRGKYDSVTVIFRVDQPLELKGTIDTALLAAGNKYQAITSLNLAMLTKYLSQADLDGATRDSSGAIVISLNSNRTLYFRMLYHFHEMEEHAFRH